MFLAIDIGNTDTVIAVYSNQEWTHIWRTPSDRSYTAKDYETFIETQFKTNNISPKKLVNIGLSSVVPVLTPLIQTALAALFDAKVVTLNADIYPKIGLKVLNPTRIGTDLVCNAMSAYHRFQTTCLAIDFGTALTVTTISATGEILGVAIAPGIKTAMKALSSNAAQLPDIPLELPDSVIGKNTVHAMQAGILWGYVGLVNGLIDRTVEELNEPCKIAATGGLSFLLTPLHKRFDILDRELTLDGLRLIVERVQS